MKLSLAVAFDQNRLIGYNNTIPWQSEKWSHIREQVRKDMLFFKELTIGHPVIMGRTTYLILPKPLKSRLNIVLSNKHTFDHEEKDLSVKTCNSLKEAIALAAEKDSQACIIGGASIYQQAFPLVDVVYQTVFNINCECGYGNKVYCPMFDLTDWSSEILQNDQVYSITKYTKN
jgi:dihydrofolate reductase